MTLNELINQVQTKFKNDLTFVEYGLIIPDFTRSKARVYEERGLLSLGDNHTNAYRRITKGIEVALLIKEDDSGWVYLAVRPEYHNPSIDRYTGLGIIGISKDKKDADLLARSLAVNWSDKIPSSNYFYNLSKSDGRFNPLIKCSLNSGVDYSLSMVPPRFQ